MHFHPRVLLATAGAANAGIDDKDVHIVIRDGFPPSMRDLAQETGRVGRRPDATPSTDRVLYLLSFISFKSLLYRIFIAQSKEPDGTSADRFSDITLPVTDKEIAQRQWEELKRVMGHFLLKPSCYHEKMEMALLNPYDIPEESLGACGTACSYCRPNQFTKDSTRRMSRQGTCQVLANYFLLPGSEANSRNLYDNSLIKKLTEYKDPETDRGFAKTVYAADRKTSSFDVNMWIMTLFASGILVPSVSDKTVACVLAFTDDGNPFFHLDTVWDKIHHKH